MKPQFGLHPTGNAAIFIINYLCLSGWSKTMADLIKFECAYKRYY